eukprot:NODE_5060_length_723_cov_27.204748_g4697_i0.p1 GENE.NODE_5060_length_723_cov_27.204748_g4697_i0~~NODE_5060_length_723_cov_27.204748_g4697_i0.p1  ORF type:complete len:203 (+),score=18.89 NODE_5060_length_723_cov_27.204748_g4697_i0:87-695(+)
MAYFVNHYSASTGAFREVCVPTPASASSALVPHRRCDIIPLSSQGNTEVAFGTHSEPSVSPGGALHPSAGPMPSPGVHLSPSPVGSILMAEHFTGGAPPHGSWWHPPTFSQVPAPQHHHASGDLQIPQCNIAYGPLGAYFVPGPREQHLTIPHPVFHPLTADSYMEYVQRPREPLLKPIGTPPLPPHERVRTVGRVERHIYA